MCALPYGLLDFDSVEYWLFTRNPGCQHVHHTSELRMKEVVPHLFTLLHLTTTILNVRAIGFWDLLLFPACDKFFDLWTMPYTTTVSVARAFHQQPGSRVTHKQLTMSTSLLEVKRRSQPCRASAEYATWSVGSSWVLKYADPVARRNRAAARLVSTHKMHGPDGPQVECQASQDGMWLYIFYTVILCSVPTLL